MNTPYRLLTLALALAAAQAQTVSGYLITVNASNVTVDFQGHYISGPVGDTSQNTAGIYAGGNN